MTETAENPFNKPITDLTVLGVFDVLSKRKVSSIKHAMAVWGADNLHIGVIGDKVAIKLQEQVALQQEEHRAKMLFFELQLKPMIILGEEALHAYIQDRKDSSRFIILTSENRLLQDTLRELLEQYQAVFSYEDAFASDNQRYEHWVAKQKEV